jgi:hypothetical protein
MEGRCGRLRRSLGIAICVIFAIIDSTARAQVSPEQSAYCAGVSFGSFKALQGGGCPKLNIPLPGAAAQQDLACRLALLKHMEDFRRHLPPRTPTEVILMRRGVADFTQCIADINDNSKMEEEVNCVQQCVAVSCGVQPQCILKTTAQCMHLCDSAACQRVDACNVSGQ